MAIDQTLSTCVHKDGVLLRNNTEVLFLAAEAQNEHGPNFLEAQRVERDILETYTKRMVDRLAKERREHPVRMALLATVCPQLYDPAGTLRESARALAAKTNTQTQAQYAIGLAAKRLYAAAIPQASFWKEMSVAQSDGGNRYLGVVHQHLETFRDSLRQFRADPSPASAALVCMDSRLASATAFSILPELRELPDEVAEVDRFVGELRALHKELRNVAGRLTGDQRAHLIAYAKNVRRRSESISALLAYDVPKARSVLLAQAR
jgi:hypothetical protein